MTRKEVNMQAFGPWCLARRHLHPYFGGERMDSLGITVSLGINESLNDSGDNSCLSTTLFEVLPEYVIMSVWGCIFFSKLTIEKCT